MDIKIKNIHKSYKDKVVFKYYNTNIKENEITYIIGKSGSGKTTLLRILMGFENIDSGQIEGIKDKRISAVFQEDRLCENLSLISNIKLISPYISNEKIEEALEKVNLDINIINKPIKELSGGMKRRVAIIRALLYDFDLLILDEPFKGLDKITKKSVIKFIEENINKKTVIIVSHDIDEIQLFEGFKVNIINISSNSKI